MVKDRIRTSFAGPGSYWCSIGNLNYRGSVLSFCSDLGTDIDDSKEDDSSYSKQEGRPFALIMQETLIKSLLTKLSGSDKIDHILADQ